MNKQEKMGWWETDRDVKRVCAGMLIALVFGVIVVTCSIDRTVEKPRAGSQGTTRTSEQRPVPGTASQQANAASNQANGTEGRTGQATADMPNAGATQTAGGATSQGGAVKPPPKPPSTSPETATQEFREVSYEERNAMRWSALLWAGACFAAGCFIGFIFGIPRSLSSDTARTGLPPTRVKATNKADTPDIDPKTRPAEPANANNVEKSHGESDPNGAEKRSEPKVEERTVTTRTVPATAVQQTATQQSGLSAHGPSTAVNTNLEQISDWLTKIIVGVSLVNSEKIGETMLRAAMRMANAIGGGANRESLALAIMVYFSVVGLLSGYLVTRLFLQRAFDSAGFTDINRA